MVISSKNRIDRAYALMVKNRMIEETRERALAHADPVEFCQKQLSWKPFGYQTRFLQDKAQFVLLRWCRQSGKTTTIAALALHEALAGSCRRIVIVGPSLRQSRRLVQRISLFIDKIGPWILRGRLLKTKLELINGSSVEGLPNNPETIRGETANLIIIDEMCFVEKVDELYDAVIYTLATTNGRLIVASTPGSRDSLFYAMCYDKERFPGISRHHVSYKEALSPNGPLQEQILENIRAQMLVDPWRWTREMEAEFAEDEDVWLPMSLLTTCIRPDLEPIPDDFYLEENSDADEDFELDS